MPAPAGRRGVVRRLALPLLFAPALALAAAFHTRVEASAVATMHTTTSTITPTAMSTAMSTAMRPVCIGRHLLDVPADFEPMMGLMAIFTPPELTDDGAPITVLVHSMQDDPAQFEAQFKAEVERRHAAIRSAQRRTTRILTDVRHPDGPGGEGPGMLPAGEATMFRIREVGTSYNSELHFRKGGAYLVASSASYQDSYRQAEERLLAFAAQVVPASAASPAAARFCLGPVAVGGRHAGEYATFGFRSKAAPDVMLSVELDTYAPDESVPLRQRMGGPGALFGNLLGHYKVLREGEVTVAGMRAQEWLGWVKLGRAGDAKHYGFALETMRPVPAEMQPRIHLALDSGQGGPNGERYPNTLDDRQALALWDAISRSLRAAPAALSRMAPAR